MNEQAELPQGPLPEATAAPEAIAVTAPDAETMALAIRIAEAVIFAADRPVSTQTLAGILPEGISATMACAALAEAYAGRGVVLAEIGGGYTFRTAADLAPRLTKVVESPRRLPRAAMEALAIIAYHQPCTRGDIEEIRGATLAQTTLESLLDLGLVAPRGRREVPGRPTLWGSTPKFLEQFSLKSLSDLPRKEELVSGDAGPALPGMTAPTAPEPEPERDAAPPESAPESAEESQ
jgi:segregation and condensation protein B